MPRFRDIPEGVKRWIPPLAAAVAAVLVFLPIRGFGCLEDDDLIYVFDNPLSAVPMSASIAEAFLSPYVRSYLPLTLLSHPVDLRLWGENGGVHRLLNLPLHAANAILVHPAAREFFGGRSFSLLPETSVFYAFSDAGARHTRAEEGGFADVREWLAKRSIRQELVVR